MLHATRENGGYTEMSAAKASDRTPERAVVYVVDDDVDPMNLEEVMWAVSTRCEPSSKARCRTKPRPCSTR